MGACWPHFRRPPRKIGRLGSCRTSWLSSKKRWTSWWGCQSFSLFLFFFFRAVNFGRPARWRVVRPRRKRKKQPRQTTDSSNGLLLNFLRPIVVLLLAVKLRWRLGGNLRERGNPPVVSWDVQTPERQSRGNLSCFIHAIDGWMDAWPSVAYAQHNKGPSPIHSEWRMRIGSSQRHWANEKTAFANIILAAACNFRSVLPADREGKKIDTNSDCVSEKKSILYVGLLWI